MAKRYFDDSSKIKAGVISDALREALDVHEDKLPIWIYRMRVLGYPPGYLKQAQVSTLSMFDDSTAKEDGELNDSTTATPATPIQYNKESFVEYPGFNTPVPEGIKDDWYILRMPPMLEQQQLKEALKTMHVTEPVPYKRMRQEAPSTSTPVRPKNSKAEVSSNGCENDVEVIGEQSKDKSLDSSLNSSPDSVQIISDSEANTSQVLDDSSIKESSDNDLTKSSLNESTDSARRLKLISMGSPMPASETPKRPALEKWSVGMGELLHFENPSAYTGHFDNKMKGLINKIRLKNRQT